MLESTIQILRPSSSLQRELAEPVTDALLKLCESAEEYLMVEKLPPDSAFEDSCSKCPESGHLNCPEDDAPIGVLLENDPPDGGMAVPPPPDGWCVPGGRKRWC